MFKWLLSKQQEKHYATGLNDGISKDQNIHTLAEFDVLSRIQDSLSGIDDHEKKPKLLQIRSRLTELVITPSNKAIEQLEITNVGRQKIWGHQAVQVPILQGSADSVFCALLECLRNDYAERWVKSLSIEEVTAPTTDDEKKSLEHARDQMQPNLDNATKDYYEKQMLKHMRKKGRGKILGAVREIKIRLFFDQDIMGTHRILRISEDIYYLMPCTARDFMCSYINNSRRVQPKRKPFMIRENEAIYKCPHCDSEYKLSDYRDDVEKIYCSYCKKEL